MLIWCVRRAAEKDMSIMRPTAPSMHLEPNDSIPKFECQDSANDAATSDAGNMVRWVTNQWQMGDQSVTDG